MGLITSLIPGFGRATVTERVPPPPVADPGARRNGLGFVDVLALLAQAWSVHRLSKQLGDRSDELAALDEAIAERQQLLEQGRGQYREVTDRIAMARLELSELRALHERLTVPGQVLEDSAGDSAGDAGDVDEQHAGERG